MKIFLARGCVKLDLWLLNILPFAFLFVCLDLGDLDYTLKYLQGFVESPGPESYLVGVNPTARLDPV